MHSEEDFRQASVPFLSQDAASIAQAHTVTRMMFFVNLVATGSISAAAELMRHRCLCADWLTGGNDWAYDIDNRRRGFKIPKSMEVDGGALLLSAALSGAGIAYLPAHVVQRYISQGKLIHLFENINTSEWALDMYYPPQNQISEYVSSFKRFLIEQHEGKFSGQCLSVH
ncbi:LysR substrate-binding domain-containing protein [Martelella alba]|nr:LysR substrate-binding domain-containing protein [Martelella alba]